MSPTLEARTAGSRHRLPAQGDRGAGGGTTARGTRHAAGSVAALREMIETQILKQPAMVE
jgi:hypothetical protein